MARKIILIAGLGMGLTLFWGVSGAQAAESVVIAGDDFTVLNSALEELKDVLLQLQSQLAANENEKNFNVAAVSVTLSQISLNLDAISVAVAGGDLLPSRRFADGEPLKISGSKDNAVVSLADSGNKTRALSAEFFTQYKTMSFTFLAVLLVFGIILFLRRGEEGESEPA
ncbi:MAG: hypothetical protein HYT12_00900 [Candidatus Liptonbacteria bacterium]|nr:hypothetical protein [Candidatus Liptonbacteria bacterium]